MHRLLDLDATDGAPCAPQGWAFKPGDCQADPSRMWFDALLVILVAALAFAGFRRGGGEAAIRLAGLPLAYAAAVAGAVVAGPGGASLLGVPSWIGSIAAGTLGFVAVHVLVGFTALRVRERTEWITPPSRVAGACLGATRALVFAIPLLWVANLAEGARSAGIRPELPDLSSALLPRATAPVFEVGGEALIDEADASGRLAARFVSKPGVALGAAQAILQDPRLRNLQGDRGFWADVERGSLGQAMRRPTYRDLAGDRAFRQKLGAFGLVSDDAVLDARVFELEMTQVLSEVGRRLAAIRSDPDFQELMEDPDLQRRLREGDAMALLSHPGLRAMIARAGEEPS